MSQMLARLQRELLSETDVIRREEIEARIAIALARSGHFDDAAQQIAHLRSRQVAASAGRGTLWAMLAEGVLSLYREIGASALDRITRVQLLAAAMQMNSVVKLASAWKAHIEFETSNFEEMANSLVRAFGQEEQDLDCATRVAIVLANSFSLRGDFSRAHHWFMRGRDCAVKNGDRVSIEALQYNKAALRLAWLRLENCRHAAIPGDLRSIRMEIESALAFQQLMQGGAYVNHLQLCEARLLVLEGKFEAAIPRLQALREASPFAGYNFNQDLINLEIAYCKACIGNVAEARTELIQKEENSFSNLDIDERVVAQWMRFRVTQIDGRIGDPQAELEDLNRLFDESDALHVRLGRLIEKFNHSPYV